MCLHHLNLILMDSLTFACATEIKFSFVKVLELNRLFGSLLDQFVSSFARADVLASFEFDSD